MWCMRAVCTSSVYMHSDSNADQLQMLSFEFTTPRIKHSPSFIIRMSSVQFSENINNVLQSLGVVVVFLQRWFIKFLYFMNSVYFSIFVWHFCIPNQYWRYRIPAIHHSLSSRNRCKSTKTSEYRNGWNLLGVPNRASQYNSELPMHKSDLVWSMFGEGLAHA